MKYPHCYLCPLRIFSTFIIFNFKFFFSQVFLPNTICNIEDLETTFKLLPHFLYYELYRVQLFHWQKLHWKEENQEKIEIYLFTNKFC